MPFKSQAQRRKFYAMANKGEIADATVKHWEDATGDKKLPERITKKASYLSGSEAAFAQFYKHAEDTASAWDEPNVPLGLLGAGLGGVGGIVLGAAGGVVLGTAAAKLLGADQARSVWRDANIPLFGYFAGAGLGGMVGSTLGAAVGSRG